MKSLLGIALIVLALCSASTASQAVSGPCQETDSDEFGAIEGMVVDLQGLPIAAATVFAFPLEGPPLNGRLPETSTDKEGRFTLRKLKPGRHSLYAYKEADGYPNPFFSVFATHRTNLVNVVQGQVTKGPVVKLGPKFGKLVGEVVDAETGHQLHSVRITIFNEDDLKEPHRAFSFSQVVTQKAAGFQILVPPGPFKMYVQASYYESWGEDNEEQPPRLKQMLPMLIQSGQTQLLTIPLTRLTKPTEP